ncbi:MAG: hypothetical protein ACI9U2_002035 [Bradymonadia bacterium]|jgi:hypothetical protein
MRIGLIIGLWAAGCVPQLDDCLDDKGCPAARSCQQGYCLPLDAQLPDAGMRDMQVDATAPDATRDALPIDAQVDARLPDMRIDGSDPCDGQNNDGDGLTDAGVEGLCCSTLEACNGVDDDCDGRIDEAGVEGLCCSTPEACNGDDDDCDGQIDEAGVDGLCCSTPETCNGLDDDCDGRTDEFVQLGPARAIAEHEVSDVPMVLQISATDGHVAVLTNDGPTSPAVLQVYDRADLNLDARTFDINLDNRLRTMMVTHGGRFIIGASDDRAGIDLMRVSFDEDGGFTSQSAFAPLVGAQQCVIEAHPDGRIAVIAHSTVNRNLTHWFTVRADFDAVARPVVIDTADYNQAGGFAAALWGERLTIVWSTMDSLASKTVHGDGTVELPLWDFGPGATRPRMTSLRVAADDERNGAVMLWQTDPDPAMPDIGIGIGIRTLSGEQQRTIGPVKGDRPTGATVDAERIMVGWRGVDDLTGRVGLLRLVEDSFTVDAELSTGVALRAPVMAVANNTVSVAWLGEDKTVYLQHHMLDCPSTE